VQNYFIDPWNVLDFVIVVGSVTDIVLEYVLVSCPAFRVVSCKLQGGPAKMRPTYILIVTFECIGKIFVNVITVIQAHTLGSIQV